MKCMHKHKAFDLILIFIVSTIVLTFLPGCGNTPIENTNEQIEYGAPVSAERSSTIEEYQSIPAESADEPTEQDMPVPTERSSAIDEHQSIPAESGDKPQEQDMPVSAERSSAINECQSVPAESADEPQEQDALVPADFADYSSIINMCRKIVEIQNDYDAEKRTSGIYEAMFDIPGETERNWFNKVFGSMFVFRAYPFDSENPEESYGYALKDVNGNGEDELFLILHNYFDGYTVLAIFSMADGKPILLDSYMPRNRCAIDSEGTLFVHGSGGAAYSYKYIYKISQDGSELLLVEGFGIDGWDEENEESIYYKIVDGEMKRVDREEISMLFEIFRDDLSEETTKYSGLVYIPLFDCVN